VAVVRITLPQALLILQRALSSGRVFVHAHATAKRGGLRAYSEPEILAELNTASNAAHIDHNRSVPDRFIAYGVELVISFEIVAPNIIVVTVFEQGG
jgi:hypothetical protein